MKKTLLSLLALTVILTGCLTKRPQHLMPIPHNPEMAQLERNLTGHKLMAVKATPSILFYDPFNNGYNTPWTFYQGSHLFTSGILRLNAVVNNGAYAYVKTNWTNVSVSSDIKLGAGSWGGAVGLRYNFTNGTSYQAWIYGSGRFAIKKYSNWFNKSTELVGVPITAPGTNVNNVKLSVVNNVLTAYLNDILLLTYTDISSPFTNGGGISLSIWGENSTSTAEFNNVMVYDLSHALAPTIVSGLSNDLGIRGQTKTFIVTATGEDLTYIWKTPSGVTTIGTNIFTIDSLQEAGSYSVTVTNATGTDYSTAYMAIGTTNILTNCMTVIKRSVALAWCPSPSTTNNEVAGYTVYYGTGTVTNWTPTIYDTNQPPCPGVILQHGTNLCRCYTNMVNAGNSLTATVSNLASGVTYYFTVTAYDTNALESDFSNEISYTMPMPIPPSPPTNVFLSIVNFGNEQVQLQAKVCPATLTTIIYQNMLGQPWNILATNVTADVYGNFSYIDSTTNSQMRFYRALLQ